MPELKIGNLIAKTPIIQGGMGVGISLSGLASAVANEGGIGIIASVGLGILKGKKKDKIHEANANFFRDEIRLARSKTKGIIGVNIMMALTDHQKLIEVAVEEKVDVVIVGAGLPLKLPKSVTDKGFNNLHTNFIPIVSSGRAAKLIFHHWAKKFNYIPDAVIIEGPKAGGHLGFKAEEIQSENSTLEKILPDVLESIKPFAEKFKKEIPVIVAGGIYTGKDIHEFLSLGASGVQMATRFVATHECDADDEFKQMYVDCKEEDITLIKSPVGLPGRAIKNEFLESVEKGNKKPFTCPWKCLRTCDVNTAPYCIANALVAAQKGKFKFGFAFAGTNAYKIDKIVSVKELMDSLKLEYLSEITTMKLDPEKEIDNPFTPIIPDLGMQNSMSAYK